MNQFRIVFIFRATSDNPELWNTPWYFHSDFTEAYLLDQFDHLLDPEYSSIGIYDIETRTYP